ncbi:unnamed protein product [Bursaphelenchus xylophilus]|uniref:(pine wood nematode) hypothetical protein n=1 Tax=Bursaphelenchus xylophilus TaxID=6326 RepID=A0A1I7SAQ4_BURXY|nr:unnamed protein product [Bursaphelenchus xylophilus]CAG9126890.1 unnamed protein product [Bursaphelenchus xylophilus]
MMISACLRNRSSSLSQFLLLFPGRSIFAVGNLLRRYILLILTAFIIISLFSPWQRHKPPVRYFAILSSDLNLYYLIHIPLVVQHWKNLGADSLLFITLKQDEEIDSAAQLVIDFAEYLGAHVTKYYNNTISAGQFAQTLRTFAAGDAFAHKLNPDNTIFITTDVDFFPSNLTHHIPKLDKGKEIMFYDKDCCGYLKWKDTRFEMFAMTSVGMTLRRWREIIDLPSKPIDSQFIETYVNATFDNTISQQDHFWKWYLDQQFFGYKMHLWIEKHPREYENITETFKRGERLERKFWPADEVLESVEDTWKHYESAHVAPGIFMENVWIKNLVLYKKIFPKEQLEQISSFREHIVKLINVTETMSRHYHPEQNDTYWRSTFHQEGMLNDGREAPKHKPLAVA